MSDSDLDAPNQPLPRLEDSAEITRQAITALVAAPLPKSIEIDGQTIDVTGAASGSRAHVVLTWPRGSLRLRVGLVTASNERQNPEDHGHRQSLQVWSEDGSREMAWNGLEWFVRDAIREGRPHVRARISLSFTERGAAEAETGIGNAELARRARELCERSGLGGGTHIEVGSYDLRTGLWVPDATTVLATLIALGLVKTALRDRGRGKLLKGEPPFQIRSAASSEPLRVPASAERLNAVHLWFGPVAQQVEGVRDALRFIAEENPKTTELEEWVREQGSVGHDRMGIYTRPLLQLGLAARDENDRWSVTEVGTELVDSDSAELLYQSFVANYIGFEETLAFYGRHPAGDVDDLLADLNARLGMSWTKTAQPTRRAYWLRAMAMLEGERGSWRLSPSGREAYDRLPDGLKRDIEREPQPTGEDAEDEGEPQPARLVADDVPMDDLQLDPDLVAKCVAALNAGKHLLLVGPPGTGKSAIGAAIARHAGDVFGLEPPLFATASADWTAYDTIGGWTQRADHTLAFRPGVLTRAIGERRWLVLDELNRADVDKCLGEAFTVLAGGEAETAFTHEDGSVVRIGPRSKYDPGNWFRVIATMNVRDKATLFRLSYALLRRFAIVEVPAPDDSVMRAIADADAKRLGLARRFADLAAAAFTRGGGLGAIVELGPAMLRDVLAYVKERGASDLAVAEGLELFVLPQLDGLEAADAKRARASLLSVFAADAAARELAVRRFEAYFPHVRFDG
jgi:MoxR-like ATPase